MFKLLKYMRWQDWLLFLVVVGLITGQVWLDLKLPEYMSEMTQQITSNTATINQTLKSGGLMMACTVGSVLFAVTTGFIVARISANYSARLRSMVFGTIQDFCIADIKNFSTPSLITRTTNDVSQIQMTLSMGLQVIIKAPITAIWAITKITSKSWEWSTITAVAVGVLLLTILSIVIFAVPKFKKIQSLTDGLNRVSRENLTGVRVVRAFNAEGCEDEKFDKVNKDLTKTNLFISRVMSVMSPVMTFVMSGLSLAIYWVGAYIINKANLLSRYQLFGDMVVFMNYAVQVVFAFIMLAVVFIILPRAIVSARRINEVIDAKTVIKDGEFDGKTNVVGKIEFKNVSFKYPDAEEYVLKDVSFVANRGDTVAFIGSTGSGKSTLINLIPRFYDVTEGQILLDDVDVKNYKQENLRKKIAYISQKATIFAGSIKDNICFGQDKTQDDEMIEKCSKIAQADSFIKKLDGEYNFRLAQNGTNVSGGQKQRISIARAVSWGGEIMIFDDSFSALDYKTDKKLRSELSKLDNVTKLIVAQRIGTIKNADQIVVLDSGKVVGIGKHEELLKTCEVYKEIALSQLGKEEVENA